MNQSRINDRRMHHLIGRPAFTSRLAPAQPMPPRYTTDLEAAWLVIVQLRDYGLWLYWGPSEMLYGGFTAWVQHYHWPSMRRITIAHVDDRVPALAICRAARLALRKRKQL